MEGSTKVAIEKAACELGRFATRQGFPKTGVWLCDGYEQVLAVHEWADYSMIITAALYAVSILISLAILSSGSKHSIFKEGLGWNTTSSRRRQQAKEEEEEADEAEEEVLADREGAERSHLVAEDGVDIFLSPATIKLVVGLSVFSTFAAWRVAMSKIEE